MTTLITVLLPAGIGAVAAMLAIWALGTTPSARHDGEGEQR